MCKYILSLCASLFWFFILFQSVKWNSRWKKTLEIIIQCENSSKWSVSNNNSNNEKKKTMVPIRWQNKQISRKWTKNLIEFSYSSQCEWMIFTFFLWPMCSMIVVLIWVVNKSNLCWSYIERLFYIFVEYLFKF